MTAKVCVATHRENRNNRCKTVVIMHIINPSFLVIKNSRVMLTFHFLKSILYGIPCIPKNETDNRKVNNGISKNIWRWYL